ncbi:MULTISPECIES: flavin reductase family protein [Pedobacter]|uniref:Flavin reductase domain protein FMN-binding n=1 Tax=Pedobacter heparinus (strain ATCC 13125 / DSM 2366 / CIP 104194 / JCM 7457 / NBRC 12017 / NCIMB 9290 / NRRL B-14731 / HIM 762-3) TaxID=485917 RepID=C6Y428_PEDHD|nr:MULTISPECIES: flavin reductase family protein [Pedobacter]ACU05471.1 flavin reductase domain protein FMN-binding [Pedobacter heparinus DSM 2366]MBB5440566.1 flavin reductase (DIM6/NTAB) family NADH-FMN oxidoreductase RutF [Pedobacter sp. AK017]
MLTIKTSDLSPAQLQNYMQYAVAPRPICFATTIDAKGNINLSPFSFFNMFSTNPPLCVFSPARRVRDNTTKHTLENILEVKECVINIVNYAMVQQTSLASTEYAKGVNEFEKAGFTMLPSQLVKPPRVAEAPVQMECMVKEVIHLGENPGAGNLILAEVKLIHIKEDILDETGKIDQAKIDLVARLGGDWYCRVTPESLFKVAKPLTTLGIGVDALPKAVRNSRVLTGNDLGMLGNIEQLPTDEEIDAVRNLPEVKEIMDATIGDASNRERELQQLAQQWLNKGNVNDALKVVLL